MNGESERNGSRGAAVDGGFGAPDGLDRELLAMVRAGRLAGVCATRLDLVRDWLDTGCSAEAACRSLSAYNRAVTVAVVEAHAEDFPWLRACTFLEFGSGGRDEQVVGSDQDNGLLLRADPDPEELADVTQSIVLALDGAGIPLCRGEVMASNPLWRGDFETWLTRLTGWLANPAERGSWQSGLILDFRPAFGPPRDAILLRERLWEYVRAKPLALSLLVGELTDYRLPLTFYGAFVTERDGPWQGFLNLKKSVLAHLTNSVRILALKYDIAPHHTCDRLRALVRDGHVSARHGEALLAAWEYLQRKRLEIALGCVEAGSPPHAWVKPAALDAAERDTLKAAIHAVEKLVRLVQAGTGL